MQSAMNALNPVMSIGAQFADALRAHGMRSREDIAARSAEVLRLVGIDPVHLRSYPHQLSGGMRQRAMIAMALLFTPDLVIMDEPTSALDVVAQRSLMVQIKELQEEFGFAVIFVTHDMSLVSHFSDRLMVMYAGQVAESGPTRPIFARRCIPIHAGCWRPSRHPGPKVPLKGIPGARDLLGDPERMPVHPLPVKPEVRGPPRRLLPREGVDVRCLLYARRYSRTGLTDGTRRTRIADKAPADSSPKGPPTRRRAVVFRCLTMPAIATSCSAERLTKHFKIGGTLARTPARRGRRELQHRRARSSRWRKSGSGKSTIARLLARLYKPTSGR